MIRYRAIAAVVIGLLFLLGIVIGFQLSSRVESSKGESSTRSAISLGTATTEPTPTGIPSQLDVIRQKLKGLPLTVKVGQMIMSGFNSEAEAKSFIDNNHLGNIVLFGPNVTSPGATRQLTSALQSEAKSQNGGLPLLISTDQEGGQVTRLTEAYGYTEFPSASTFGCIGKPDLTRQAAKVIGEEMRAIGLNMDLAPVLDVNTNPSNPIIGALGRSFSPDPESVATQARAFIAGLHDADVAATGKHFPGHGATTVDSHLSLPTVFRSLADLESTDIEPFRQMIAGGGIDAVMTAHVLYPALDAERPASLSPVITGQVLRRDLGFDGVVMTDSLSMGAITDDSTVDEAAVKAIEAGADIVAIASADYTAPTYQALLAAVQSGRLTEQRIDESVSRIMLLKQKLEPAANVEINTIGSSEQTQVAQRVIAAAQQASC